MLVFVAAERRELEGLLVHMEEVETPGWPVDFARIGRLQDRAVTLVANGPGPKLAGVAVDTVKQNGKLDALVSTGFCGGLRPSLGVFDIFIATGVNDVSPALLPQSSRPFKAGKLLSIDRVVSTAAEKAKLAMNADAVEMEAAAVIERAKRYPVPFYAVRVVTDTCEESFSLDFNQMRDSEGRFNRAKIAFRAVREPATLIPELIKLNKTTKRAAEALGDFLADARF